MTAQAEQTQPAWTTEQLAAHLNVSVRTVEGWRYRGGGPPYIHAGRRARYLPADVNRWLRQHRSAG